MSALARATLETLLRARKLDRTLTTAIPAADPRDDYAIAASGVIATLADQDAGQRGQFVEFFGRPASTHKAVALLALEFNTSLLVLGVPRVGEGEFNGHRFEAPERYRIILSDYIDPEEYAGRPDAVKAITQRYTTALERVIRVAPEQYFWLHRRWKHQPKKPPTKSRGADATSKVA